MPVTPQSVYEYMAGDGRDKYLTYAEDTAKLTLPWLSPRGVVIEERPWSAEGTGDVRSLSSAMLKITMPAGVQWGRFDLPEYIWNALHAAAASGDFDQLTPELVAIMQARVNRRSNQVITSLTQKNTRARVGTAILRNVIEGSTLLHNTPDGLEIFPLRSFACRRDEFGRAQTVAVKQEIKQDPIFANEDGQLDRRADIYTLIDYDLGRIWRQVGQNEPEEIPPDVDSPLNWILFVGEIPDVEDYPTSYAYNFLRLINQVEHAESALAEAMAAASWNPVGIREGSALSEDPQKVTRIKTGEPVVMQEGDIFFPDKRNMLADWSFIHGMQQDNKAELGSIFAKGIKDRPIMAGEASATAILEIVDELNSQTQDLLSAYEETLQKPLLRSEMWLYEQKDPLFPPIAAPIMRELKVVVTTGVNALDKQRTMMRFALQFLPAVRAMDPSLVVDGKVLADRMAEGMLIDTEGIYSKMSPLQMAMQQAAAGGALGGAPTGNGARMPREETVMTAGGPQPPQAGRQPPPPR